MLILRVRSGGLKTFFRQAKQLPDKLRFVALIGNLAVKLGLQQVTPVQQAIPKEPRSRSKRNVAVLGSKEPRQVLTFLNGLLGNSLLYGLPAAESGKYCCQTKLEFVYLLFRFTSSISAISSANGRYSPPHHSKTCMPSSSSTDSVSVITVL